MKVFFVDKNCSGLVDDESRMLVQTRQRLLRHYNIKEVFTPRIADVILMQEKFSYKDFRYIDQLLIDPLISKYAEKIFTINCDDCATGLLRGLYTSLPIFRYCSDIHAAIPYMEYPNELVFRSADQNITPSYLASWRGNTKSNVVRSKMISALKSDNRFLLESTDSWLNHQLDEKRAYVDIMLKAKFSLCPAGWAPVSFRIYESMALGRCPVIIADEFVPPAGPAWRNFALFFSESKVSRLPEFLNEREHLHQALGRAAQGAWNAFFAPGVVEDYVARVLLALIRQASETTKGMEEIRWRSSRVYWTNRWTLPQRVLNKAFRFSKSLVNN